MPDSEKLATSTTVARTPRSAVAAPPTPLLLDEKLLRAHLSASVLPKLDEIAPRAGGIDVLSPNQSAILTFLVEEYRRLFWHGEKRDAKYWSALVIALGAVLSMGFGMAFFVCYASYLFFGHFGVNVLVVLIIAFTYLTVRIVFASQRIEFVRDNLKKPSRIKLGRFGHTFDSTAVGVAFMFAVLVATFQTGFLYFNGAAAGVSAITGFRPAFLATANTFLDVALVGILRVSGIQVGPPLTALPWWPAFVIGLSRATYAALLLYSAVSLYRRFRIRKFIRDFPKTGDARFMLAWCSNVSSDSDNWGRIFHDELVFNLLATEYVHGNFDVVRAVARQFRGIRVDNDVRALFVHPQTGELLFYFADLPDKKAKAL